MRKVYVIMMDRPKSINLGLFTECHSVYEDENDADLQVEILNRNDFHHYWYEEIDFIESSAKQGK